MVPVPGSVMVSEVAGAEVLVANRLKLFRSPETLVSPQDLAAVTCTPVAGSWKTPVVAWAVDSSRSGSAPSGSPSRSTELVEVVPDGNSGSG